MNIVKPLLGIFSSLLLSINLTYAADCDPINTYCQSTTTQVCELSEDVIEKVSNYVCILVPDPKWYNPGNVKRKCLTEYKDKLIKGSSICSNVTGLSCPSVTGSSSLSCSTAMNVVSACLKSNSSACAQAHTDAAIAATFGPTCSAYAIYQSGVLETTYETRLYNLIDTALDTEIKNIFGTFLGDSTFDDYVRGTVAYYKTSNAALDATVTTNSVFRAKTTPGKIFFNNVNPPKDLIIHELVHVWQYRKRGVQGLTAATCSDIFNLGSPDKQYKFTLTSGKKFSEYGVEQQAEIVQTYYNYKNNLITGCASGGNFENCSSYSTDSARTLALKNTIAGTSSSALPGTILFSGYCSAQYCEGPSRNCSSQNGRFSMSSGDSYICYSQ